MLPVAEHICLQVSSEVRNCHSVACWEAAGSAHVVRLQQSSCRHNCCLCVLHYIIPTSKCFGSQPRLSLVSNSAINCMERQVSSLEWPVVSSGTLFTHSLTLLPTCMFTINRWVSLFYKRGFEVSEFIFCNSVEFRRPIIVNVSLMYLSTTVLLTYTWHNIVIYNDRTPPARQGC